MQSLARPSNNLFENTVTLTAVGKTRGGLYSETHMDDRIELEIQKVRNYRFGTNYALLYDDSERNERAIPPKSLAVFQVYKKKDSRLPPFVEPFVYSVELLAKGFTYKNMLDKYNSLIGKHMSSQDGAGKEVVVEVTSRDAWNRSSDKLEAAVATNPGGVKLLWEKFDSDSHVFKEPKKTKEIKLSSFLPQDTQQ